MNGRKDYKGLDHWDGLACLGGMGREWVGCRSLFHIEKALAWSLSSLLVSIR